MKGVNSALPLASRVLLARLIYLFISTAKYSFSLLLLCHQNTIDGSTGKTNYSEKPVWPEEEVSSAQTQPPSRIYRAFFGI